MRCQGSRNKRSRILDNPTPHREPAAHPQPAVRSIRHQIVVVAQCVLDVERRASRCVGISSARGHHTQGPIILSALIRDVIYRDVADVLNSRAASGFLLMPGPANLASKVGFWSFQVGQPSAILILPALVNRMPPKTSSIYPSSISRALCSDGMRCIKPLAPSRNETNSSRVNGGADGAILGICAYGRPDQAGIRRFPRWPVSDGLQGGNAPAALLESHAASSETAARATVSFGAAGGPSASERLRET
jgi:hypothetical protein